MTTSAALSARLSSARSHRDYSPVHWSEYFDEAHDIHYSPDSCQDYYNIKNESQSDSSLNSFRVYLKNFQDPFAPKRKIGQKFETISRNLNQDNNQDDNNHDQPQAKLEQFSKVPTLVLLHGGGYSALTWSEFSKHIDQHCQSRILAIDLRAHGDTNTNNEHQMDIDTLVSDVNFAIHASHRLCGFQETPKLVLIGHSMGGAIAIKCASKCVDHLPSLAGFVVIDVVEGTAKEALPQMMSVIKTRPTRFPSLPNAIEWSIRSGMAKNSEAARVSMPGNLVNLETGQLAVHDILSSPASADVQPTLKRHKFDTSALLVDNHLNSLQCHRRTHFITPRVAALRGSMLPPPVPTVSKPPEPINMGISGAIGEEREEEEEELGEESLKKSKLDKSNEPEPGGGYTWRTNLARTEPFWNGWFDGLSNELLNAPVQGKFLLLAGIDRLDKTLTIGQMQGKFMMKVLPKCGHAVHEDVPEQVASVIGDFLVRNKFTTASSI